MRLRNFELKEFGNLRRTDISRTHPNLADLSELSPTRAELGRTRPNLAELGRTRKKFRSSTEFNPAELGELTEFTRTRLVEKN